MWTHHWQISTVCAVLKNRSKSMIIFRANTFAWRRGQAGMMAVRSFTGSAAHEIHNRELQNLGSLFATELKKCLYINIGMLDAMQDTNIKKDRTECIFEA